MRVFTAATVAIFLSLPICAARADDTSRPNDATKELLCAQCRHYPITLQMGSNGLQGKTRDGTFRKVDGYVGASLHVREWLIASSAIHIGRTWFTYSHSAKDMAMTKFISQLSSSAEVSIETGIEGRVYEWRRHKIRLSLWIYGEFEAPLYRDDRLNIEGASFSSLTGGSDIGEYVKKHGEMYYSWYRGSVGLDVKFDVKIGWRSIIPKLRLGYERFDSAVDIHFDKATLDLLTGLGQNADKAQGHFPVAYNTAIIVPGLEVQLLKSLWVDASGIAIPVNGNWFLGWMFRLQKRF